MCASHWRPNLTTSLSYGTNCLAARKHRRYRHRLRLTGCQSALDGKQCPWPPEKQPYLNLHHKVATRTRETFSLIEDPTCSEREFHNYLHDPNLVCLCEVCHRLAHPDKLIKGSADALREGAKAASGDN